MRVFIVDDSVIVRERLAAMLSELPGVELIGQAGDVAGTIEAIGRLKPDAVILDIRMPGGTGIDVLEAVKKEQPAPLVIVLTNYPYPQYRTRCEAVGADFFLDKSSEFDKIPEIFRQLTRDCPVC